MKISYRLFFITTLTFSCQPTDSVLRGQDESFQLKHASTIVRLKTESSPKGVHLAIHPPALNLSHIEPNASARIEAINMSKDKLQLTLACSTSAYVDLKRDCGQGPIILEPREKFTRQLDIKLNTQYKTSYLDVVLRLENIQQLGKDHGRKHSPSH